METNKERFLIRCPCDEVTSGLTLTKGQKLNFQNAKQLTHYNSSLTDI